MNLTSSADYDWIVVIQNYWIIIIQNSTWNELLPATLNLVVFGGTFGNYNKPPLIVIGLENSRFFSIQHKSVKKNT